MKRRCFLAASSTVTTVVIAGCGSPDGEDDDDGGDDAYDLDEPKQLGPRDGAEHRDDVRDGIHTLDSVDG